MVTFSHPHASSAQFPTPPKLKTRHSMRSRPLAVLALCSLAAAQENDTMQAVPVTVNMTTLAHHVGEAAVGLSCGAVGAWILRKVQGAVVTLTVLGSIGTIAALHLKWVSVDQVRVIAIAMSKLFSVKLQQALGAADLDEDGELTLEDSRIAYSRVAPVVRRHAALSSGAIGGFAAVYGAMR